MTEKGKKPGAEPLSATGMFLNAFGTQPEPPAEQPQESSATGSAKPAPGEFTQMFHKLEPPPSPPLPQTRSTNTRDSGDFTRMFVAAATSHDLRPGPAIPDPAPSAPAPTPKMKGFSAPGISDSASPEGSFTQLFRTPPSTTAPPPLQPFTPFPMTPPQAAEPEWPRSSDPAPNRDAMAPSGLSELFRSLSEKSEPTNQLGEPPVPAQPSPRDPASVTMLIQKLTEDLREAVASAPPTPAAGAPAGLSGPGEFTRIIAGGVNNQAGGPEPGVAAGTFAMPAPPTPAFPATPAPAFAAPQFPAAPAPAFAPQAPAVALPQAPPAPPPKVTTSAPPPPSKFQQMLPMFLVLNAFLLVVLILLVVFVLRSR
jgi:hypothetical protein